MRLTQQIGSSSGVRGTERREVLKGAAEQIIRVRVPVPGLFREAVFFLHEDYLRRADLSREELLRQAKQAATEYLRPMLPEKRPARWIFPLLMLIAAAVDFGLGVWTGL